MSKEAESNNTDINPEQTDQICEWTGKYVHMLTDGVCKCYQLLTKDVLEAEAIQNIMIISTKQSQRNSKQFAETIFRKQLKELYKLYKGKQIERQQFRENCFELKAILDTYRTLIQKLHKDAKSKLTRLQADLQSYINSIRSSARSVGNIIGQIEVHEHQVTAIVEAGMQGRDDILKDYIAKISKASKEVLIAIKIQWLVVVESLEKRKQTTEAEFRTRIEDVIKFIHISLPE